MCFDSGGMFIMLGCLFVACLFTLIMRLCECLLVWFVLLMWLRLLCLFVGWDWLDTVKLLGLFLWWLLMVCLLVVLCCNYLDMLVVLVVSLFVGWLFWFGSLFCGCSLICSIVYLVG